MDKRTFIKTSLTLTTGVLLAPSNLLAFNKQTSFELPALSYSYGDLAPHIDKLTMEIHHTKHHQAYINNLNKAIEGTKYAKSTLADLLNNIPPTDTALRNNGGGHYNHSLFWTLLTPNPQENTITENLTALLVHDFGSVEKFKELFKTAALSCFGSGWAWLLYHPKKSLQITSTPNQDNVLMKNIYPNFEGYTPILCLDVWEHAYYLNYQNKRADYIDGFWKVVNWTTVAEQIKLAK
jgi:Fe-Mn family superoxide dismutase